MNRRRLEALRNLAERPGTEAEGRVARAMLGRHQGKSAQGKSADNTLEYYVWRDELAEARQKYCDCGNRVPAFTECCDHYKHAAIDAEKRRRFPVGSTAYYNCWAYPANDPGVITGYSTLWSWINIKFSHLSRPRRVPIYIQGVWHLSPEPLPEEQADQLIMAAISASGQEREMLAKLFGMKT